MKSLLIAATAASVALPVAAPAPAFAQSREVRQEMRECNRELSRADSRKEYRREQRECRKEINQAQRETRRDRRQDWREDRRDDRREARNWRAYRNYDWNRREPGTSRYYADQYYRPGNYYEDRSLGWNDRIYRGQDSRYYCRRNDGTTGLIVGAGLGALLGNQLNVGGSTTLSTIAGGAAGALLGRAIERNQLRCD